MTLSFYAKNNGLSANQVRRIRKMGNLVAKTGENFHNNDDGGISEGKYQKAQDSFQNYIKNLGFDDFDLPGFYPVLIKGDDRIDLD